MNAHELLSDLQSKGARFEMRGESFTIKAPHGLVTAELREELRELKPEILSLLTQTESQIEARFFKGLDCPRCQKPVEGVMHPLDEEVWMHCVDPECLIKTLHHDSREWCADCGRKLTVIAGRCVECLRRVLLSPNEPCQHCGAVRFWRDSATAERPAGYIWHCARCHEPIKEAVYFELPNATEEGS